MTLAHSTCRKRSLVSGFGIIEIMVALALGAVLLLGVTEIFSNNSLTRAEVERTSLQIESGAYALGLLEGELANAGYWGEADERPADTASLPPVCPITAAEIEAAMGYPVQGAGAAACMVSPKAGTDYIAIRRANSCAFDSCPAPVPDFAFYMQVNACFNPLDPDEDPPGVTVYIRQTPGEMANLATGSRLANFGAQRDCTTAAPIYGLHNRVFYVNSDDELVRAELTEDGYIQTVLVEGVEMMAFEYGIDQDGDGQVDVQASPGTDPVSWSNVSMVRVSLVIRNLESTAGYLDNRSYRVAGNDYTVPAALQSHKRQVYSRTVGLRNVAGRRELP
ncbi:PilW family protein [Kineobactrum salinum]|uniref:Prepilin-type N-terminal cleavage/methylation domain-containing protein n=1 Tax=Kineobactrum salinum TaxID=2708301 RepID=A0A6C0U342_9GAMM|nr:PilW family protein [Kineobactrum salinum]QIB66358.1 hypothetical protein G3T16_14060 [Kineobactrum salinum]